MSLLSIYSIQQLTPGRVYTPKGMINSYSYFKKGMQYKAYLDDNGTIELRVLTQDSIGSCALRVKSLYISRVRFEEVPPHGLDIARYLELYPVGTTFECVMVNALTDLFHTGSFYTVLRNKANDEIYLSNEKGQYVPTSRWASMVLGFRLAHCPLIAHAHGSLYEEDKHVSTIDSNSSKIEEENNSWSPDTIDPSVDIMKSIRDACNGN